jgi:hypothetical protein
MNLEMGRIPVCIKCAAMGRAKTVKAPGRFLVQSRDTHRIIFHGYLCGRHRDEFEVRGHKVTPMRQPGALAPGRI